MGEVYRARDARLSRDVAIKVLPPAFTEHPDRLARFEREARVLASLSHPGIAAIYGIEESHGVRGLVLELVDGGTLADRLAARNVAAGRSLPIAEVLTIARQIAEALDAAHEAWCRASGSQAGQCRHHSNRDGEIARLRIGQDRSHIRFDLEPRRAR